MPYTPTVWENDPSTATPLSAANLNKLTDELDAQATEVSVSVSLPTWTDAAAPALTEATPWNQLEAATLAIATALGLSYVPTQWEAGWSPARNAARLNKLEQQAAANRSEIENPQPSNALLWAPPGYPAYEGYQQRTISNSQRSHVVTAGTNVDAVFTVQGPVTADNVTIQGFRNVVIIGGEFNRTSTSPGNLLRLFGIDGICHLEGLYLHGAAVTDVIGLSMGRTLASGAPGGTFRMQNCRLEASFDSTSIHSDCVQIWSPWAGPNATYIGGCGPVQIDRLTCYAYRQALFFGNHDGALGDLYIQNCEQYNAPGRAIGHLFFKTYRQDVSGRTSHMTLGPEVYVHSDHSDDQNKTALGQSWVNPDVNGGYDGTYTELSRRVELKTDAQGEYFQWVSTADITGIARAHRRAAGEFVPASMVTQGSYVSPGYL